MLGGVPFDDSDTFALIFESNDSVSELSGFAPYDIFVMIEDTFFQEHSSGCPDVNFCCVLDVWMKDKLRNFGTEIEPENFGELMGLQEGFGEVLEDHCNNK
jgi:hypothetical protein